MTRNWLLAAALATAIVSRAPLAARADDDDWDDDRYGDYDDDDQWRKHEQHRRGALKKEREAWQKWQEEEWKNAEQFREEQRKAWEKYHKSSRESRPRYERYGDGGRYEDWRYDDGRYDDGHLERRPAYRPYDIDPGHNSPNDYFYGRENYRRRDEGYDGAHELPPPIHYRRETFDQPDYAPRRDYDPYRSQRDGSRIGSRIGELIGGPEGATIGGQIGAEIGAEIDRSQP